MQGAFPACINFTLLPGDDGQPFHVTSNDPGGATAWGITRVTLSRWLQRPASVDDVRALTKASVQPIYEAYFWKTISGDKLPAGVNLMVFDHGVVAGEHESAIELQTELGFTGDDIDGDIGPITLRAVAARDPAALITALSVRQADHYRACANFVIFGRGWLARVDRRVAAGIAMLNSKSAIS
jgi:lysozyme family protein